MVSRTLVLLLAACTLASAQRTPPSGGPRGGATTVERPVDRPNPMGGPVSDGTGFTGNPSGPRGSFGPTPRGGAVVLPPRPGNAPPVTKLSFFKNTTRKGKGIIFPPGYPRCTVLPDMAYWASRDLMAEIQWLSRAGYLPVTPVDPTAETLVDYTWVPSGWKAYGFAVPPGGRLQVEVQHLKPGWFRLMAVDQWGKPGPGMLEASIAHRPVLVTVSNPEKEAKAIYIIVDDPAWWSSKADPYTLVIRRDWDPAAVDLSAVKMVNGLWGSSPSVSAEFRGPSRTGPAHFPH